LKVGGKAFRTIWPSADSSAIEIIDQRALPYEFRVETLRTVDEVAIAIKEMWVRGAPLIGATAAYGVALAVRHDSSPTALAKACEKLAATRPTAVNLRHALDMMRVQLAPLPQALRGRAAFSKAAAMAENDVAINQAIGKNGLKIIEEIAARKGGRAVNILTHCNAGWLATVDWGTATAPIYMAHDKGVDVHVYVDETRPRNQGASLTAWELGEHGVPYTLIVDNAGGHLMQHDEVDLVIVGTDRTTAEGDVANKIGTYLKALAAHDNNVPFYVALPSPTIDWRIADGLKEIPIEERSADEVLYVQSAVGPVRIAPEGAQARNPAFDVTPARLVTALITERGVCAASRAGLLSLFPERAR
jgi:methylthioribose-1-phosphate isomerase